METGYLNQFFIAVAVKRLSQVEAAPEVSHQHEYNGVALLRGMFGTECEKKVIPTQFLYLSDEEDAIEAVGELTWYDARFHHPTRTEWRLYYPTNDVTTSARAGDSLFICLRNDGQVLEIVTKKDSLIENQLFWLFGIRPEEQDGKFKTNMDLSQSASEKTSFAARIILYKIGVEAETETEDFTDLLLRKYGDHFPTARDFSEFARSTIKDVDPIEDPDDTLLRWYDRETTLFKCMERLIIQERLKEGFSGDDGVDVDSFIQFSLSVNNRRKARAGFALENHLEELFRTHHIIYSHTPVTENKSRPDFIFPSIELYRDMNYPAEQLTMLGAKTTAKDRWRQVLEEADRITHKHLITLEGAISENQTNEMISRNLQLVVPHEIQGSFTSAQQTWLYSVKDFLDLVSERQAFAFGFFNKSKND